MTPRFYPYLFALSLPLLAGWAQAACPSWPTAERFALNGAQVTDLRTGLVWARCSVGQAWNGSTCSGSAIGMTLEEAFAHAQGQVGWRLPNVKELASLADRGCYSLAIDTVAFPGTPPYAYWSSTPNTGESYYPWYVHFGDGGVFTESAGRYSSFRVRLVRVGQ